jgi:hypothetical protein
VVRLSSPLETGHFGHDPKLMGRNDDDPRRSHGGGCGVLILTTCKTQAMHEQRNRTDVSAGLLANFDLNYFVGSTIWSD